MVTALSQDALSLSAAAKLPNAPDRTSLWRWCCYGLKAKTGERIHLEAVRLGGKLFTSRAAIDQFSADLAAADRAFYADRRNGRKSERQPSDRQQAQAHLQAEKRLRARGIL